MIQSDTAIANLALTRIGTSKRLASLATDQGAIGQAARANYPQALRASLNMHPWDFALKRENLPADAAAPAFGYARAFTLPGDCLRWLPPEQQDDIYFEAEQEGEQLLTDADAPLPVRYIRLVEDVRLFSPHFVDVLVYRLGLDLAYAVSALAEVSRLTEAGWVEAVREARRIEGRKAPRRDRHRDVSFSWLDARA
jgi:hypothetical protein